MRSVADGDTLRVDKDGRSTRVRLLGIDAPEVANDGRPAECYGPEAAERARALLTGRRVWLEYDAGQDRQDRFGRDLAYVWLDDTTLVNRTLLAEGYVREYTYDQAYRYQAEFRTAQREAQGTGLWSACRR